MDEILKINDLIQVTLPQGDGDEGKSLEQVLIKKRENAVKDAAFNPSIFKIR